VECGRFLEANWSFWEVVLLSGFFTRAAQGGSCTRRSSRGGGGVDVCLGASSSNGGRI